MRQTGRVSFGAKFAVKYWHAKHENRECCPQHGALDVIFAGSAFSAVTIAVPEPFLLPTAENWHLATVGATVARGCSFLANSGHLHGYLFE
jgi:hypothetical protein